MCYDICKSCCNMYLLCSNKLDLNLNLLTQPFIQGADQRKHQSSASLAFVRVHRSPVNSPHKGPVTRKMFPFDDVIMDDNDGEDMVVVVKMKMMMIMMMVVMVIVMAPITMEIRADSGLAPSKWETSLQSNAVSRWPGANLESSLEVIKKMHQKARQWSLRRWKFNGDGYDDERHFQMHFLEWKCMISLKFVPKDPALVQMMAWRRPTSH